MELNWKFTLTLPKHNALLLFLTCILYKINFIDYERYQKCIVWIWISLFISQEFILKFIAKYFPYTIFPREFRWIYSLIVASIILIPYYVLMFNIEYLQT